MSVFCVKATAAQSNISVKGESISIKQAIQLIEKQTDYTFFYNDTDLKGTAPLNINCQGDIDKVLRTLFADSGITYTVKGKEVILKTKAVETTLGSNQTAGKVTGVVIDSRTGDPIPGATIRIKGKQQGTTTDIDGRFEIVAAPTDALIISFIGYTNKEVKVGKLKVLQITLSDEAQKLDEVVVTAFGTGQKKESLTGSITQVKADELKMPTANLSNSFAGRLAGVISYQRSGEPGSNGSDFFIRGVATFGAQNPLIILDGVEISKSDLNALDPEIIESFSVLKDATASAMYGTRGANGVMIITTKSGRDLEKPVIGFRVETYINTPIKRPRTADAETFMRMYNEAVTQQGTGATLYSEDKINGTLNALNPYVYPNVDWYKEIFKDATWNQKANFNVRGGTQKLAYFMNINVNHEEGMLKNSSSKYFGYKNNISIMRYAFQNNIDFHFTKTSTLSLHLNVQLNNNHAPITGSDSGGVGNMFSAIMEANPVDYPIMYPIEGEDDWYHWGTKRGGNYTSPNPVAIASSGYKDSFESTVMANLDFEQKLDFITKGLKFKALFSFKNWSASSKYRYQDWNEYQLSDYSKNEDGTYNIVQEPIGTPSKHLMGYAFGSTGDRRFYIQAYFDYNRKFGDHHVSGLLLYNQTEYNPNVYSDNYGSYPKRRAGVAIRVNYDFNHRYLFEFNAGMNGTEAFAVGHRWGFFPSVSAGWNLSEEKFWHSLKNTISNFKIRGSYGLVGNDNSDKVRFMYLPIVNLGNSPSYQTGYGNDTESHAGPTYNRFYNPEITWEIGRKMNIGADLQFFRSLNLTIDAFKEIRNDIFRDRKSIPNYFGTTDVQLFGNYAKVKNYGVEFAVDYGKRFNKDLSVQFKGTFTFARNKILEDDVPANERRSNSIIGHSLDAIFGYVADGLYVDWADIDNNPRSTLGNIAIAPGDVKYVDQPDNDGNYDGKIDNLDKVSIGYPTKPEIVYGFGPSITYKKWDFSFFFQGQANVSLMMSGFAPFGTQGKRNVLLWVSEDYWSKDNQNPNARYPRLTQYDNNNNMQSSTYWLRNAAFLKLKSLEVGYSFKWGRIYLSGANLLTISPFKLWDPELGGGKGMSYPLQRTYNLGIQFSFK
jgi:TonB-linked SusC/RagA family outer membrane protein